MRPIDADYIRGALEAELCREDDDLDDRQWACGYAAGVDLAICKLAETPTLTPTNEWVSVEERLPEPGERVLAANGSFVGEAYMASNGAWMRHDGFPWEVDAWMPMPDRRPPEGEEK